MAEPKRRLLQNQLLVLWKEEVAIVTQQKLTLKFNIKFFALKYFSSFHHKASLVVHWLLYKN